MNGDAPQAPLWEELLPVYDVSDELAIVVGADAPTTWDALLDADLIEVGKTHPIAGLLSAVRMLPEIVAHAVRRRGEHGDEGAGDAGEDGDAGARQMRLRDLVGADIGGGGSWMMLGERPGSELAIGLVGKFWKPVIEFADVTSTAQFEAFDTPGFARTVYAFKCVPLGENRSQLTAVMRTATTDEHARRWFRRYWMLGVESGAHVLVNGLLENVCAAAEVRAALAKQ